jgi:hypothetical protein
MALNAPVYSAEWGFRRQGREYQLLEGKEEKLDHEAKPASITQIPQTQQLSLCLISPPFERITEFFQVL